MNEEKERIAQGYDVLAAEDMGMDTEFHERCVALHSGYAGNILDIGCGAGRLLQKIHAVTHAPAKFYGLDISEKLCEISRRNNPYTEVTRGDAEALPYKDDTFDIVFMTEALEHLLDYDKALSEVRRVLKPRGVFIVTVPNRDWARYDFYDKLRNKKLQPIDDHYFRVNEIRNYLRNNSFRIVKYRGSDNLYYYAPYHKYEQCIAFFFPFLYLKMKRLLFKCVNEK